jgi:hypothetical protein
LNTSLTGNTWLPIVARPLEDEAIGSWLSRLAACYSVPVQTLLIHLGLQRGGIRNKNWLTLAGFSATEMRMLAQSLRQSIHRLADMAPSAWCLPNQAQFGMCAHCVMEAFQAGRPLYWRRDWIDAVTVGCIKHGTWLTPVDADLFLRSANWNSVEQGLIGVARQQIRVAPHAPSSGVAAWINMSALGLQSIFTAQADDRVVQIRYGALTCEVARRIAQDLLDV